MGRFDSIGILVRYDRHTVYSDAHTGMNQLYGGLIPDISTLFIDPGNRDNLVPDAFDRLLSVVIDQMIVPVATSSTVATVTPLLNKCPFKVSPTPGSAGVRATSTAVLKTAMINNLKAKKEDHIELSISIIPLHFPSPCTYLNWTQFSSDPMQAPPPPPTLASLVAALTKPGSSGPSGAGSASGTIAASSYFFNPSALDPDVKEAYERYRDGRVVTSARVSGPFTNGHRYAIDGQRLILRDGTLFLMDQPLDEKGLLRDPVVCTDDSLAGIRAWYNTLVRHAIDHGVYVHPLYLFRKDQGGPWGFKAGNDPDDDLPQRMELPLNAMSQPLFRLLNKTGMFPKGSSCLGVLTANYGDGYKALKQILYPCHPVFHEQPATLVTSYPYQKDKSLIEYHGLFLDYLQMRAFICNNEATLDSRDEMDIFISRTKHYKFLNRVTREERTMTSKAYKYTSSQIIETLASYLNAPDSPVHEESKLASVKPKPKRIGVNSIDTESLHDSLPALAEAGSDDSFDTLMEDLHQLEIPDDFESYRVLSLYSKSLYALKAAKDLDTPVTCIVCGGTHRFDKCDVLNNHEFLRGHYIRYCQQARRDATARAAAFAGTSGEIPQPRARVNVISTESLSDSFGQSDDSEDDRSPDFQTGRR